MARGAEDLVHRPRAGLNCRGRLVPVRRRGQPGAGVPEHVGDLLERHASCGQQAGRGVPQLVGCQRPRPACSVTVRRDRRRWAGSSRVPLPVGKTSPRSCQCSPISFCWACWRARCCRRAFSAAAGSRSCRRKEAGPGWPQLNRAADPADRSADAQRAGVLRGAGQQRASELRLCAACRPCFVVGRGPQQCWPDARLGRYPTWVAT